MLYPPAFLRKETEVDKERAAVGMAGPRQALLDATMDSGEGGQPLITSPKL